VLFTSCVFLFLFLPVVVGIYLLLKNTTLRNLFLMLASLFFYTWGEMEYFWVMLLVIAVNYVAAICIEMLDGKKTQQKLFLAATIATDLLILGYFKYAGFFVENANPVLAGLKMPEIQLGNMHLPLGISFFCFHSLSYVVDVFRKTARAQRNPFNMALYISLFPQLVAGPIVRYHEISDQLNERTHTVEKFAEGIRRLVTGLAKKMLIANALALPTDRIFAIPNSEMTTQLAWLGALCYAIQIYFDFSGYSDMAVGLGLMFGFRLPENFNYPYISKSMREFWTRWHMSLSNFFRDYVYIPLGGNRCPTWRVCFNLVTIFFLCGLWHGASWQYVLWGFYHGAWMGAERAFLGKHLEKTWLPLRFVYTQVVLMFSWALFRAENIPQQATMMKAMLGFGAQSSKFPPQMYINNEVLLLMVIGIIACLPVRKGVAMVADHITATPVPRYAFRTAWFSAVFLLAIFAIAAGTYNPFVYFRF
jgi:alginate O-acetyltransferase complex protein AlgI